MRARRLLAATGTMLLMATAVRARLAAVAVTEPGESCLAIKATFGYPLILVEHLQIEAGQGIFGAVLASGGTALAAALAAAAAGDDLVLAVAVDVGGENGVAVDQRVVDHLADPGAFFLAIDSDLIAVPGFDGGEETFVAKKADGDIGGAGFGPGSGIAIGDFFAFPGAIGLVEGGYHHVGPLEEHSSEQVNGGEVKIGGRQDADPANQPEVVVSRGLHPAMELVVAAA